MDRYNSKIARFLGWLNKKPRYAITISKNTTLYSVGPPISIEWNYHEERHRQQYAEEGWCLFVTKYLTWLITKGYQNNPYEIDARMYATRKMQGAG